MDAPPVNKLLQLLRQKPPEPPDQSPVAQAAPPRPKRRPTPVPKSGIQHATNNGTQTATNDPQCDTLGGIGVPFDGIQYTTQGGTQPATNSTQPATNSTQPATDRSIPHAGISNILYATFQNINRPLHPSSLRCYTFNKTLFAELLYDFPRPIPAKKTVC